MLDRNIALVSRRFFGIILSDHLAEIDLTDHDVRVRLESGVLERRHEKVLVIAGAPRTWTQDVAAATAALDGSVAGEESAARILSLHSMPITDSAACEYVEIIEEELISRRLTWPDLEMYLGLLREAEVPLPEMQITAPWAERRRGRVDAMYPDARSIIELDGRRFHERFAAFEEDRLRDQLAVLEKFRTARFTYRQIKSDPDHVVAVTRFLSQPPA